PVLQLRHRYQPAACARHPARRVEHAELRSLAREARRRERSDHEVSHQHCGRALPGGPERVDALMQLDLMRRANEPIVRVKNSIEWSDARKAGKRVLPPAMLRAYVTESSSSIANGDPFWTIANSGNEDRDGEKIADTAWRLDDFMKNPVMPWSHMWYCSPVGKWLQAVPDAGGLKAQGQFAVEADDFAAAVARHFAFGSLRSFSVGFDPRAWTEADGKTYTRNAGDMFPGTRPGRTYTEVVLLEISPVVLPP